jgi:hypothetical protein
MFRVTFDPRSNYTVRFPKAAERANILALAQSFVVYERSLPAKAQTPFTAKVIELLGTAVPVHSSRLSSEAQRTVASEAVKRLDAAAKLNCEQIYGLMKVMFPGSPERAKEWGFQVKQTTRNILHPRSREARLALLNTYIAKEESRPAKERFAMPSLDQVRQVRDELQANLIARNAGRTQRETSIVNGRALAAELLQYLQAAAVYLLADQYRFSLSPDLRKWGFEVVALRNGYGNGNGNSPANGHGTTNGDSTDFNPPMR